MAFSIKNDEADALVRELTAVTGESLTTAVTVALRERLQRERLSGSSKAERVRAVRDRIRATPVITPARDQDLFGWDEIGLPT